MKQSTSLRKPFEMCIKNVIALSKARRLVFGPFSVPFPILTYPELENGGQYLGDLLGYSHLHQFNIVNDDLLPKHVLLTSHNYKY